MNHLRNCSYILLLVSIFACTEIDNSNDDNGHNFNSNEQYVYKEYNSVSRLSLFIPLDTVASINKKDWVDSCKMIAFSDVLEGKSESFTFRIKGRGNSTWNRPKKPYSIKFYNKESLFELPQDKSWVLLANYFDPTHLRNSVAFYMSRTMSKLDYTPRYRYTTLEMNDKPWGLYQIGEKLKPEKERVCGDKSGFLIEVDAKAQEDEVTFKTPHMKEPLNIKEPDVKEGDEDYNYIKDFILKAEHSLFSENFLDDNEGYRKYIDEESFVEWYLINEIAKNIDAAMYTSCYMNFTRGGKLKMGPIWDFDLAFGNYVFGTSHLRDSLNTSVDLSVIQSEWYNRLFEDPAFKAKVKTRFSDYYANRYDIYNYIDIKSKQIENEVYQDNKVWERLGPKDLTFDKFHEMYYSHVEKLKLWIEDRFIFLNNQYSKL